MGRVTSTLVSYWEKEKGTTRLTVGMDLVEVLFWECEALKRYNKRLESEALLIQRLKLVT